MPIVHNLLIDEQAAAMPEYALLIALIAVTAIAAISLLGDSVVGVFSSAGDTLDEQLAASGS